MKSNILYSISIAIILFCNTVSKAQYGPYIGPGVALPSKIIVESGNITPLKAEKQFNVQYDYSSFGVGVYKTEEEYTNKKVSEYNAKEPGKGDKWLAAWVGARKESYQPSFEELINKIMSKKGVRFVSNTTPKYTLIVKTTFLEPGHNVGVSRQSAYVNFDFIFVETAAPSNVIFKLYIKNVVGATAMGFDFDVASRVRESYAKAGKTLGKYLKKELFK